MARIEKRGSERHTLVRKLVSFPPIAQGLYVAGNLLFGSDDTLVIEILNKKIVHINGAAIGGRARFPILSQA